jgi:hypothetical protein
LIESAPDVDAEGRSGQEFVRRWLELRIEKEVAERLKQADQAIAELEPTMAQDAERQAFVRRWLELRVAKEKGEAPP